ncbi:MAG: hypothetical protein DMF66_17835 [Acidobacteria bacterium]|nr:MAG: hypothetical protein DMF66_17835 [Acidobacteriota bacterium]
MKTVNVLSFDNSPAAGGACLASSSVSLRRPVPSLLTTYKLASFRRGSPARFQRKKMRRLSCDQ